MPYKEICVYFSVKEGQLSSAEKGAPVTVTGAVRTEADSVVQEDDVHVMFLTPDQERARRHMKKGVLTGPAGTGKTIVLRAMVDDILQNDDDAVILYIAVKPHDTRMLLHFQGELFT